MILAGDIGSFETDPWCLRDGVLTKIATGYKWKHVQGGGIEPIQYDAAGRPLCNIEDVRAENLPDLDGNEESWRALRALVRLYDIMLNSYLDTDAEVNPDAPAERSVAGAAKSTTGT